MKLVYLGEAWGNSLNVPPLRKQTHTPPHTFSAFPLCNHPTRKLNLLFAPQKILETTNLENQRGASGSQFSCGQRGESKMGGALGAPFLPLTIKTSSARAIPSPLCLGLLPSFGDQVCSFSNHGFSAVIVHYWDFSPSTLHHAT